MLRPYTGVGSRETPEDIQGKMSDIAEVLARHGYTLRSGAADGADRAFEQGAQRVPAGSLEIFLPWKRFNGSTSLRYVITEAALELAATAHPRWKDLGDSVRNMHARNCYQVLGETLQKPSEFLIAWTPDGCETEARRSRSTGGTGTAIALADRYAIPVFNLKRNDGMARLSDYLKSRGIALPKSFTAGYQTTLF